MRFAIKTIKLLLISFFVLSVFSLVHSTASAACPDPILKLVGHTNNPLSVVYHFQIKNCAAANGAKQYKLTADLPGGANSGWKIDFTGNKVSNKNVVTVAENATVNFDGKVTPPANATVGSHNINYVAATNINNANAKDVVKNIGYVVTSDCKEINPTVTSAAAEKTGAAGAELVYTLNVKNNNVRCTPADFKFTALNLPTNWTVDFVPNAIANLKNGQSDSVKVKIKSKVGSTGAKTINIEVANKSKPAKKDSFALKYTIQESDPVCTGADINPHFECQNNACVKVNACGANTGGCTTEGATCQGGTTSTFNLDVVLGLNTIGTTGTNRVPAFTASNKNPNHQERTAIIELFTLNNEKIGEAHATVMYQSDEGKANYGKFVGSAEVLNHQGYDFVRGNYIVKITVPGFLTKQIPGTVLINPDIQDNAIPAINLTNGDINMDNRIGIEDYNLFISCSIFAKTNEDKAACNTNDVYKLNADINDDGTTDQIDYIYFLQEFSVQNGD